MDGSEETERVDVGWQRIGRPGVLVLLGLTTPGVLILPNLLVQLLLPAFDGWPRSLAILVGTVGGVGLALLLMLGFLHLRYPRLAVSQDGTRYRVGRHERPASGLTWAKLLVMPARRSRRLTLTLGGDGTRVALQLRGRGERTLRPAEARAAARLLANSSIELPQSPHDPTGRFARYNFPENVSRDTAVDLVLRPPAATDELPIGDRVSPRGSR